ncbi:ribose-phosphate pyrophosphokinase 1/Prs1 [Blumeria hordei DH14]|uniref:ribose-phosphate diphosphokinase n=1 Tax=Blumeria graminis f. sp. hordei (strain DH14) TaxID=546991 RepID=N1JDH7_BLUG1|nr:ribose-phosphate pyrophosphokinase 1/Prs1 [Blumeria hordei DH14]
MRNVLIFAGSSCPALADHICARLAMNPASVELSQFANGETSVKILTSIRDKDVYVVQSGSSKINDSIMELLIMISACKGGSANKITAGNPKKNTGRGAITARMLANLLDIAGVKHIITIDLHASQMQGFFKCPVDNLHAEPLISRWIRHNVENWNEAICVSKNAGGTKRVTSLADALKLNFGMVTTDKKRGMASATSNVGLALCSSHAIKPSAETLMSKNSFNDENAGIKSLKLDTGQVCSVSHNTESITVEASTDPSSQIPGTHNGLDQVVYNDLPCQGRNTQADHTQPKQVDTGPFQKNTGPHEISRYRLARTTSTPEKSRNTDEDGEFIDERARDIIQGRLVHGHIVPDDYPSPIISSTSNSTVYQQRDEKPIELPHSSSISPQHEQKVHNTDVGGETSDEEEAGLRNPQFEHMITLVGDVRNRTVFIIDDMIDKAGSWIAAAECVVKRGGAKKVYCMATHGLFGGDSLEELQECDCIDSIVVTNSFPIPPEKIRMASKLVVLDLSSLLAEAIRRNHHGESISVLFTHSFD